MSVEFERQVDRGCRSKRAYCSRETADIVIAKTVRVGRARVGELSAYQCRHCKYFHIGHVVPKHVRAQSA